MKYRDLNGILCELTFTKHPRFIESNHVLVICRYNGQWVLTKHNERGIEFPGGKVEAEESLQQAAKRELYEETGVRIAQLEWYAAYIVYADPPFCKTVFVGKADQVEPINLMETQGLLLMDSLEITSDFSFLMKDKGMRMIVEKVRNDGKWND